MTKKRKMFLKRQKRKRKLKIWNTIKSIDIMKFHLKEATND